MLKKEESANIEEVTPKTQSLLGAGVCDVSTIILSSNDREYLRRCLTSYKRAHNPPTRETIVVINGSKDGTVEMLDEEFPGLRLVINSKNRGVARGRNQGIHEARGAYILFLDSDAEIGEGAIQTLYAFMEAHPEVAVVAPKLLNPDGSLQYSARRFPTPLTFILRGLGITEKGRIMRKHLMRGENISIPKEVDWVMGACIMVRSEALADLGFFDEKYFFGYEDADFCYRARRGSWKVVYHPGAVAMHHYRRRSAERLILNKLKWAHGWSALRFFRKRYVGG